MFHLAILSIWLLSLALCWTFIHPRRLINIFLYSQTPITEETAFLQGFQVYPDCYSDKSSNRWRWVWNFGGVILTGWKGSSRIKTYHSCSTNHRRTDMDWNAVIRCESLASRIDHKYSKKTSLSATLSITIPRSTNLESNVGLLDQTSTTNCLRLGTASLEMRLHCLM